MGFIPNLPENISKISGVKTRKLITKDNFKILRLIILAGLFIFGGILRLTE